MTAPEEPAFDSYVLASGPRLKRLAFLLTGDLNAAEDLLQAAYAKVLPRWGRISGYDNPDAYLRRVMVSIRTSWWRRLRGREVLSAQPHESAGRSGGWLGSLGSLGSLESPADGDPARIVAELDVVLRALRTLPRRQQVAVVLRHYCDLSEAETAAVMGISTGGVKSLASKGLAALRAVASTPDQKEQIR